MKIEDFIVTKKEWRMVFAYIGNHGKWVCYSRRDFADLIAKIMVGSFFLYFSTAGLTGGVGKITDYISDEYNLHMMEHHMQEIKALEEHRGDAEKEQMDKRALYIQHHREKAKIYQDKMRTGVGEIRSASLIFPLRSLRHNNIGDNG